MNEHTDWRPTKFEMRNGHWRTSLDPAEVNIGSRIMADSVARFYQDEIPRHAKGRLLDLGCGKAPLFGMYFEFASEVVRADQGSTHGSEFIDIQLDINEPLPFADATFDTVILSDVLEHLRDPANCLAEIHRVLKVGGKLILNVPFYYWLHETPYDFFRYTCFGLKYIAEQVGLQVVSLRPLGGAPEVLLDVLGKVLMESRTFRPIAKPIMSFYEFVIRSKRLQRYSRRTAASMPLAYGMVVQKPG
ncbi:MAG: class I SAM-dependent methyltransferase [Novosphingobium sp.]|nr:class I SAM-dependent methyltransferase [Novosphingobium sp.]